MKKILILLLMLSFCSSYEVRKNIDMNDFVKNANDVHNMIEASKTITPLEKKTIEDMLERYELVNRQYALENKELLADNEDMKNALEKITDKERKQRNDAEMNEKLTDDNKNLKNENDELKKQLKNLSEKHYDSQKEAGEMSGIKFLFFSLITLIVLGFIYMILKKLASMNFPGVGLLKKFM